MHDPYVETRLDIGAFPPVLRAASIFLSTLLIAVLLFGVFTQAAQIVV